TPAPGSIWIRYFRSIRIVRPRESYQKATTRLRRRLACQARWLHRERQRDYQGSVQLRSPPVRVVLSARDTNQDGWRAEAEPGQGRPQMRPEQTPPDHSNRQISPQRPSLLPLRPWPDPVDSPSPLVSASGLWGSCVEKRQRVPPSDLISFGPVSRHSDGRRSAVSASGTSRVALMPSYVKGRGLDRRGLDGALHRIPALAGWRQRG